MYKMKWLALLLCLTVSVQAERVVIEKAGFSVELDEDVMLIGSDSSPHAPPNICWPRIEKRFFNDAGVCIEKCVIDASLGIQSSMPLNSFVDNHIERIRSSSYWSEYSELRREMFVSDHGVETILIEFEAAIHPPSGSRRLPPQRYQRYVFRNQNGEIVYVSIRGKIEYGQDVMKTLKLD